MKTSRTKTIYRISIFFVIVIIKTYRFVIRLKTKKVKNQLYVIYAYKNCIWFTSSLNTDNCSKVKLNE